MCSHLTFIKKEGRMWWGGWERRGGGELYSDFFFFFCIQIFDLSSSEVFWFIGYIPLTFYSFALILWALSSTTSKYKTAVFCCHGWWNRSAFRLKSHKSTILSEIGVVQLYTLFRFLLTFIIFYCFQIISLNIIQVL